MDIVVCNGANHSQFAARFQHEGQTVIKAVYNYSNLYEKIYFDGLIIERNWMIQLLHYPMIKR